MNFYYKILIQNKDFYTTMVKRFALLFLCSINLTQHIEAGETENEGWAKPALVTSAGVAGAAINIGLHYAIGTPWSIAIDGFRGAVLGAGFALGAIAGENRLEWEDREMGSSSGHVHKKLIDRGEIATLALITSLCMLGSDPLAAAQRVALALGMYGGGIATGTLLGLYNLANSSESVQNRRISKRPSTEKSVEAPFQGIRVMASGVAIYGTATYLVPILMAKYGK